MNKYEVVKMLTDLRDEVDGCAVNDGSISHLNFNDGIFDATWAIDMLIEKMSKMDDNETPNDIKKESGLYHN